MKRSIVKTAEKVYLTDKGCYSMTINELQELIDMVQNVGVTDALFTAFNAGYVLGHRATVAGKYTEHKG